MIARLFVATVGISGMLWAAAVVPVFWTDSTLVGVAKAVAVGEIFKPEILAAIDTRTEGDSWVIRSSVLSSVVMIRLRRVEDAMKAGDPGRIDKSLQSLSRIIDQALSNAPNDSFLWLSRYWLFNTRNGSRSEYLPYLKMSYELGPYEGWISTKRSRVALAAFSELSNDLADRAISEFVGLVRWGFFVEAADIAGGPARPIQKVLFPRLKNLKYEQRRAFAQIIYQRELDDVPVPGIEPPHPNIPMPVLPPGF